MNAQLSLQRDFQYGGAEARHAWREALEDGGAGDVCLFADQRLVPVQGITSRRPFKLSRHWGARLAYRRG